MPLFDLFAESAPGTPSSASSCCLRSPPPRSLPADADLLLRAWNVPLNFVIAVGVFSICPLRMAIAGGHVERFGAAGALAPAFICGAALLASLGYVATSPLARIAVMGLLGFAVPLGASGTIALTATFYPTAMRSAGTGLAMGLGRFGQVLSPLVIGLMMAMAWAPANIFARWP